MKQFRVIREGTGTQPFSHSASIVQTVQYKQLSLVIKTSDLIVSVPEYITVKVTSLKVSKVASDLALIVVAAFGCASFCKTVYKLYVKPARLNCNKHSFFVRIVKLWNELLADIVEADSFQHFKSKLKMFLNI